MKKILLSLAAVAMLAACSKEDTLVQQAPEAIGFDNAFVENSTRSVNDPSYTNTKLFGNFGVFGTVEGAKLFDNVLVSGSALNGDWTYTNTQYWIAGAKYNFAAVAPKTVKVDGVDTPVYSGASYAVTSKEVEGKTVYSGTTTLSFVNNGETDLLYAEAVAEGKAENNSKVAFSFRHVLSKVKFSFENAYNATNATIRVKNITITNPHKTANAVLSGTTVWSDLATDSAFTLNFGMATDNEGTDAKENVEVAYANNFTYESQNELFLIPSATAYDYNVTFTVELLISGSVVATYPHTATAAFAPEAGKAYDIKTIITPENIDPQHKQEPIQFTVTEITDWVEPNNVNM